MDYETRPWAPQGNKNKSRRPHGGERPELKISSWNIGRGLFNKEPEIDQIIESNNINFLFLLETDIRHFKTETFASYIPILQMTKEGEKVQVFLLIRPQMKEKVRVRTDLMEAGVPMIWIEVETEQGNNIMIAGVYREWQSQEGNDTISSQRERLKKILQQVEKASQSDNPIIFMGDLNLDGNRFNDKEYHLKE